MVRPAVKNGPDSFFRTVVSARIAIQQQAIAKGSEMSLAIDGDEKPRGEGIRLSSREVEILSLIASGSSSEAVSESLIISKRAVDFHLASAYWKLRVDNRVQAILAIGRLGLAPKDSDFEIIRSIVDEDRAEVEFLLRRTMGP